MLNVYSWLKVPGLCLDSTRSTSHRRYSAIESDKKKESLHGHVVKSYELTTVP